MKHFATSQRFLVIFLYLNSFLTIYYKKNAISILISMNLLQEWNRAKAEQAPSSQFMPLDMQNDLRHTLRLLSWSKYHNVSSYRYI